MSKLKKNEPENSLLDPTANLLTFNFMLALPGRASSVHTQRAYFRWVDTYLVDLAGLKASRGDARIHRMQNLPITTLQTIMTAPQLRAWLGMLAQREHGKQGIDQARAAIVTLADLLAEAQWIDDYAAAAMGNVRAPHAEDGQRPGRWLSLNEIQALMVSARAIATTEAQAVRNELVIKMLCTMALRREELSVARWGDLSIQNERVVLQVHGKGRKVATIDVPGQLVRTLTQWRRITAAKDTAPPTNSPLIRRIWKGGRVAKEGLSPDGIWLIIDQAARSAGLGHVAPHDLRRSVAGALNESGVPIEKISQLLRHSNVAITERYLSRLPRANQGAVLMSQALGWEDDTNSADWLIFES